MTQARQDWQGWQGWVEVCIEASVDSGELLGMLDDPGATGAWQENGVTHLYWPADRWNQAVFEELQQVLRRLNPALEGPVIRVAPLPEQDWNEQWARSVKPIRIGRHIVVRPSWATVEEVALQAGEVELILDPKQAFGTGHHATTQLLIEWLEEVIRGGECVLDVGTGSGILAMVALRLGAGSVLGIDHDPVAIDCAREYAAVNGFGPELDLRVASLKSLSQAQEKRVHLVLANLDRKAILESVGLLEPYLCGGARLLLSGILRDDRAEIVEAFGKAGGTVQSWRERDGWLALEILVPEDCEGAD